MKHTTLYIIVLLAVLCATTARADAKGMPVEILCVHEVSGTFPKFNLQATIINNTRRAITIMPESRVTVEQGAAVVKIDDEMRLEPKTVERKTVAIDCQFKLLEMLKVKQQQEVRVKLELLVKVGKAKKAKRISRSFKVPMSYLQTYLKF